MRLENIGAEDIVDGNPRMILALIWTVILRFQIQEIEIDVDEDVTVKVLRRNLLKMLCCFGVRGRPMAISKNWFGVMLMAEWSWIQCFNSQVLFASLCVK